jgi:integrase
VRKMRDERADTPGAANTIVRMLKLVLNFGVEEEWIEANPAAKMKLLRVGEWRAWTDEECAAFEARWPAGTMKRRAYALALFTGQRKSDLVLMARAHRKGGTIRIVQGKTGEELWIPEHRELSAELARYCRSHELADDIAGQGVRPGLFWGVVWRCHRSSRSAGGLRLARTTQDRGAPSGRSRLQRGADQSDNRARDESHGGPLHQGRQST